MMGRARSDPRARARPSPRRQWCPRTACPLINELPAGTGWRWWAPRTQWQFHRRLRAPPARQRRRPAHRWLLYPLRRQGRRAMNGRRRFFTALLGAWVPSWRRRSHPGRRPFGEWDRRCAAGGNAEPRRVYEMEDGHHHENCGRVVFGGLSDRPSLGSTAESVDLYPPPSPATDKASLWRGGRLQSATGRHLGPQPSMTYERRIDRLNPG